MELGDDGWEDHSRPRSRDGTRGPVRTYRMFLFDVGVYRSSLALPSALCACLVVSCDKRCV